MTLVQRNLHVYNPNTQWGDRLFLASDTNDWTEHVEFFTNEDLFPWWEGKIKYCSKQLMERKKWQYKFYVAKGGDLNNKVWEKIPIDNRISTVYSSIYPQSFVFGVTTNLYCDVCEEYVSGAGVLCSSLLHGMHLDCFIPYICTQLDKKTLPLKCYDCDECLLESTWYTQVDPLLRKRYEKTLKTTKGYALQSCPNADCQFDLFFETATETVPEELKCKICSKQWCTECNRHITSENGFCSVCKSDSKDLLVSIMDATDEIAGTKCPECGLRGQKSSEECTHIHCACDARYCYCCGELADDIDTTSASDDPVDKLFGHNNDWEDNEDSRCPMYLYHYSSIYVDFPDDNEEAQERFHQIRAVHKLRKLKDTSSTQAWDTALALDPALSSAVDSILQVSCERY
eukprot:TRINITY_DN3472_c0_g1_i1.p1 TRINITY_DN3472_c0_g1~~TRINITY_DN3472_c0_g1_i1.p1  ORF type:complete len:401 (+),score=73.57 TRINITY_DN3472_c0_g1_i1:190-1392(+)